MIAVAVNGFQGKASDLMLLSVVPLWEIDALVKGTSVLFSLKIIEYIRHSFPFLVKESDAFFCYCTHLLYLPSFVSDHSHVPQVCHAISYTNKNEGSCFWTLPQSAVSPFSRVLKWQTVLVLAQMAARHCTATCSSPPSPNFSVFPGTGGEEEIAVQTWARLLCCEGI